MLFGRRRGGRGRSGGGVRGGEKELVAWLDAAAGADEEALMETPMEGTTGADASRSGRRPPLHVGPSVFTVRRTRTHTLTHAYMRARMWTDVHPHRTIQPWGPTCRVLLPLPHFPPPLACPPPSPLEHSLTSVIKMKQASQSRRGETM